MLEAQLLFTNTCSSEFSCNRILPVLQEATATVLGQTAPGSTYSADSPKEAEQISQQKLFHTFENGFMNFHVHDAMHLKTQ